MNSGWKKNNYVGPESCLENLMIEMEITGLSKIKPFSKRYCLPPTEPRFKCVWWGGLKRESGAKVGGCKREGERESNRKHVA